MGPRKTVPVILGIIFAFICSVFLFLKVMPIVVEVDFILCGFLDSKVTSVISFGSPIFRFSFLARLSVPNVL